MSRRWSGSVYHGTGRWEDFHMAIRMTRHSPTHDALHADCCGRDCGFCQVAWPCVYARDWCKKPHPPIKANRRRTHR